MKRAVMNVITCLKDARDWLAELNDESAGRPYELADRAIRDAIDALKMAAVVTRSTIGDVIARLEDARDGLADLDRERIDRPYVWAEVAVQDIIDALEEE